MKRLGVDCLFLDISHKSPEFIQSHFPTVYEKCLSLGIDITQEAIPIVPAAHYTCGGVITNEHGESDVGGLYCIGETAFTGLHGANRLASNSLLEGVVFARRAADKLARLVTELRTRPFPEVQDWQVGSAVPSHEEVIVAHNWEELRRAMWNYVGIVRSSARLRRASRRVAMLQEEIGEYYWKHLVTRPSLELRNIATVAELIIASAQRRHESRGLHYNIDYPETLDSFRQDTVMKRGVKPHPRDRQLSFEGRED